MFKNVKIEHVSNSDNYVVIDRKTGLKIGEIRRVKDHYEVWMRGFIIGISYLYPAAVKLANDHLSIK